MPPELKHVCDIDVDVGPVRDLGLTPYGRRRIVAIHGGRVHGPHLEAVVIPGGADWQYVRSDGVVELEARYALRTSEGTEIAVTNRGLRRAPAAVMERLSRGEPVDARNVYFRTVPVFEAPAGPYDWLNQSVFIATAERLPTQVHLSIFEVA
jgi:uncharacterized protein DUF3237